MWIGVISDSYAVLRPEALDVFDGVDYILHCGNIGPDHVLEQLSQRAPVAGVLGPNDSPAEIPFEKTLYRKWQEVGVYVAHRIGEPSRMLHGIKEEMDRLNPEIVLFAKVEGPFNTRINGRLFFNPGPAGKKRSRFPPSVGILEIDGRTARGEIVLLKG